MHAGPLPDGREGEGISASPAEAGAPGQGQGVDKEQLQKLRENGVPVVLMYGENDWMDINGGYAAERKIKEEKRKVLTEESKRTRVSVQELERRDNGDARVVVIKRAGHHVYLDNAEQFNEVMLGEMRDVERREEQMKRGR